MEQSAHVKEVLDSKEFRTWLPDRGGYIDGVTLVAVPIFDQLQRLTHTIVCAGVSRQLHGARVNALVHDMQSEARMLETQLIA